MLLANFPYQLTLLNPSLTKNNEIDFFVDYSSPVFFFFEISIIFYGDEVLLFLFITIHISNHLFLSCLTTHKYKIITHNHDQNICTMG